MSIDHRTVAVHRSLWILVHGPITRTQELDHKCENRMCVNPDHLELVSRSVNQQRMNDRKIADDADIEEEEMDREVVVEDIPFFD